MGWIYRISGAEAKVCSSVGPRFIMQTCKNECVQSLMSSEQSCRMRWKHVWINAFIIWNIYAYLLFVVIHWNLRRKSIWGMFFIPPRMWRGGSWPSVSGLSLFPPVQKKKKKKKAPYVLLVLLIRSELQTHICAAALIYKSAAGKERRGRGEELLGHLFWKETDWTRAPRLCAYPTLNYPPFLEHICSSSSFSLSLNSRGKQLV